MTCSNFDCFGLNHGKRKRCSRCRFSKILTCSNCGDELDNVKKLLCVDCAYDSKLNYVRDYQRNYKRINRTKGITI